MNDQQMRIDKLAFGGSGIGRLDGKACFVPFTAPGDEVRISIISEKSSYLIGEMSELVTPSPARTVPPCPVFGDCGGCNWQHLDYKVQLEAKEDIFAETLWRSARIEREFITPIIPAEPHFAYRSRLQFKVRFSGGKVHLGFYRKGTHYVIDLPAGCAIAHPAINDILGEIRALITDFPEPDKVPQVDAAAGEGGETILIFHYIGHERERASRFLAVRGPMIPAVKGLFLQYGRKATIERVFGIEALNYLLPSPQADDAQDIVMQFSRGGFSQVNYLQNRALVSAVLRYAALQGNETVLDLFCGNGNFTLPLALLAKSVVGIEEYGPSLEDARRNTRLNDITNTRFICADAAAGVKRLQHEGTVFSLVILDPPRTGARDAIEPIISLQPEKIIYISCDPTTLGRDLAIFLKNGYDVVSSCPVDMFPQTYHIESVTLLERTTGH